MEYWVLGSDNTVKGPYAEQRLRSAAKDGSLRGDRQICAVGSDTWTTVAAVFGRAHPSAPVPPGLSTPTIPLVPAPVLPLPTIPLVPAPGLGQPDIALVPTLEVRTSPQPTSTLLGVPAADWVPIGYLWPVISTLCCSPVGLIGGVIAIVCAAHANALGARGDVARAARLARASKWWMIATFIVGALFNGSYVLVSILTMGS